LDKTAATAQVGAQINLITAAITSTTSKISALPHENAPESKRVGVLVIFTTPLTSSLSLLIVTIQVVLNVVLAGVITLLNTILGSLALALSGL
jgi:hypothetical protein